MSDLEKAKQKEQEAREKLERSIETAVRQFYRLMSNKTDYQRLDPDIESEIKGRG